MSNLVKHAEFELRKAGFFDKGGLYDGALGDAVMELVRVFAAQGHSGMSAPVTIAAFKTVAAFEPIGPLTGDDDEWNEVGDGVFQNRRCSHVFKQNGEAYDIQGKIFREPNGCTFINSESRVPVTFPYTPKSEVVDRPAPAQPSAEREG